MPKTRAGTPEIEEIPFKRRRKDSDERSNHYNGSNIPRSVSRGIQIIEPMPFPPSLRGGPPAAFTSIVPTASTSHNVPNRFAVDPTGHRSTGYRPSLSSSITRLPSQQTSSSAKLCRIDGPSSRRKIPSQIGTYCKVENDAGGFITNISLKNFMNHDSLDLAPHNRVNIITGPNGAGKSSLLQAVVLGLGKSL